jgi:hypothetical protein
MGTVTPVEELRREITDRLRDAAVTIDSPDVAEGAWWVDVERNGRTASVEWRPGRGFGIAGPGGTYGEGPDYVVNDAVTAAQEVVRILDRRIDVERAEEIEDQFQSILQTVTAARQHYENVMRAMAAQMGIQIPPALHSEMRQVSDEVRRVELELTAMAETLLREHSPRSTAKEAEN